jgi:hypothetical protein
VKYCNRKGAKKRKEKAFTRGNEKLKMNSEKSGSTALFTTSLPSLLHSKVPLHYFTQKSLTFAYQQKALLWKIFHC